MASGYSVAWPLFPNSRFQPERLELLQPETWRGFLVKRVKGPPGKGLVSQPVSEPKEESG
jgi:hypothetical protein